MLSDSEIVQLNDFGRFLSWKSTWAFRQFIRLDNSIIVLFTGNRSMKTSSTAYQYVLRFLGWHPVPKRNFVFLECSEGHQYSPNQVKPDEFRENGTHISYARCPVCGKDLRVHDRQTSVYRFAMEVLPGTSENVGESGESAETKNAVVPEFKKWLPPFLIKKDFTYRNYAMTLHDVNAGKIWGGEKYPGKDIIVEFSSYAQGWKQGAGVDRIGIWVDEESPYSFYEEQIPRLLTEDGDLIMTLTPAERVSWTMDEFIDRADIVIRTEAVRDFLKIDQDVDYPPIQRLNNGTDIAIIMAATDDNPLYTTDQVDRMFAKFEDPSVIAIRRFGIHKQVHGRIYKEFQWEPIVIESERYFSERRCLYGGHS